MGRRIDFVMPTHSYGETTTPADPHSALPYTLQVRGKVGETVLQGLGYTQDPVHIQGELGLNFSLYETPGQPAAVLNVDAGQALLGIKATDWKKPAGEAAQFSVAFDDQGGQAEAGGLNLSRIFGSGDHVRIDGRASFDSKGNLEFADFSNLYLKDFIDVTFKYYVLPDQKTNVFALSGQQLDLRPWLDSSQPKTAPYTQAAVLPAVQTGQSTNLPTHIVVDLASLKMTDSAAFKNLKFDINWDGQNGFDGGGSALGDTGSPIVIGLQSEGNYSLFSSRIGNLGDVIRTATDNRNLYDGVATFDGAYRNGQFDATLDGKKVRVKQIPVLAQLLTVASLRGLNDTLIGDGIAFSDFNFPIRYRNHAVFIRNGYAAGDALGINVWGTTDLDTKTVALNGTLIPAYGINSLFGAVKSNGLGLVGLKYDLKGSTKAPVAEVNPLSLVLPGFIKVWAQAGRKDLYPALDLPNYKDKLDKLHDETQKNQ